MTTAIAGNGGPIILGGKRTKDGGREFKVRHLVEGTPGTDGPANVMQTPGLPLPGSFWFFGGDLDVWAFCGWDMDVSVAERDNPRKPKFWSVDQTFRTPQPGGDDRPRCQEQQIEDPLLQPQEVSGGLIKYTEEATTAENVQVLVSPSGNIVRQGTKVLNSAHELIRGPQAEFDANRDTITIKQNVADLQLDLLAQMRDTVNSAELWGLPERCVKFSNYTWAKRYYGLCYSYYERTLTFETWVREDPFEAGEYISGFDRDVLDEGTKVLRGQWDRNTASPTYTDYVPANGAVNSNPADFVRFKDFHGENARVILDGQGLPIDTGIGSGTGTAGGTEPGIIRIKKYRSADLLLLGIPTSF